jgi:ubiquinone/menaquinone biosynthesis C-methylase UbiE
MGERLTVVPVPEDRMCQARALDNPLRRRFSPAAVELDPLDIHPGMTVADLGAGVGYFAPEALARVGEQGRLWLVDIDEENLAIARQRLGKSPNATFVVGSAAHADAILSGSVDRVLASLVLCCLVDKAGAMDEIWRVLRPGGLARVTYPRIGLSWYRRKRAMRVTPALWEELRARHPWRTVDSRRGWFVTRHLLEKPESAA